MKDLITVIVPVYNVEKFINRCITSIINQSYKNLEIILVDDGSTDNCGKICDDYAKKDNRIKVIHKENGGISDARNTGVSVAKGKYVTFIDSDDYVKYDYIEFLYNLIIKNKVKVSICSHTVLYNTGLKIEKETEEFSVLDAKTVVRRILYDDGIDTSVWAKMYETTLFNNIKYPKGKLFEDAAITCRILSICEKIAIGSKSKYFYMIRSDSITNENFNVKKMDLITSTKEMGEYIIKKYPDLQQAVERRIMYAYLSTLSQLANSKEKHLKEQKEMMEYITKNRKKVLKDKNIPKRDRMALEVTKFGFNIYKIFWNLYRKQTKRK